MLATPAARASRHSAATLLAVVQLGTAVAASERLSAQAVMGNPEWLVRRVDVYVSTRDRWRGVRRNAMPWVQGDLSAGVRWSGLSLSAGGWAAVETGSTEEEPRADLRAGSLGMTAATGWVQAAASTGGLVTSVGVVRDWYRRTGSDPAVTELYGSARLQPGTRWSFALSAWHAVSGAGGTYLEPAWGFHHFINPFTGPVLSWTTALRAGFQAGARDPAGGAKVAGPEGTGLTHVALSSTVRGAWPVGYDLALLFALGPELQYGRDAAARRRRDGSRGPPLGFWWPLQVGLSYPVRRPQ